MVDLNSMVIFVCVVEMSSFSQAARQLGIPKATVSRKVAELERDLGTPLLHRTTRKLHLTEACGFAHKVKFCQRSHGTFSPHLSHIK